VEVDIKVARDNLLEGADREPQLFGGNRETIMAVLKISDTKTRRSASKHRVKRKTHRVFSEAEGESTKNHEQMESTTKRGGWMVDRRPELGEDAFLKSLPRLEVPFADQSS
jgi:hypothetical protein